MNKKIAAITIALLAVIIFSGFNLDKFSEKAFSQRHSEKSSSALLDILGELRYTAAAVLWMKTDYYHHEFEFSGKNLTKNEPIMPLIRMITILDPHFVQAYDFGAYHLAVNLKHYKESMDFLKEGLQNNPNSFELNWEYGFLLYKEIKYNEALPYLMKARKFREQKTPVYDEWIKMSWVNSRIADCLRREGRISEAKFYQKELESYLKAVKNNDKIKGTSSSNEGKLNIINLEAVKNNDNKK